jgi:exodeoxyribonuclease VII small subunit
MTDKAKPQEPTLERSKGLAQLEKSLQSLEALVDKLESGDLPLEKALAEFERGIKLTRQCQLALQEAEQRIEILLSQSKDATPVEFDPDAARD